MNLSIKIIQGYFFHIFEIHPTVHWKIHLTSRRIAIKPEPSFEKGFHMMQLRLRREAALRHEALEAVENLQLGRLELKIARLLMQGEVPNFLKHPCMVCCFLRAFLPLLACFIQEVLEVGLDKYEEICGWKSTKKCNKHQHPWSFNYTPPPATPLSTGPRRLLRHQLSTLAHVPWSCMMKLGKKKCIKVWGEKVSAIDGGGVFVKLDSLLWFLFQNNDEKLGELIQVDLPVCSNGWGFSTQLWRDSRDQRIGQNLFLTCRSHVFLWTKCEETNTHPETNSKSTYPRWMVGILQ